MKERKNERKKEGKKDRKKKRKQERKKERKKDPCFEFTIPVISSVEVSFTLYKETFVSNCSVYYILLECSIHTERFISYRKYILQITQLSQYRCTQLSIDLR